MSNITTDVKFKYARPSLWFRIITFIRFLWFHHKANKMFK